MSNPSRDRTRPSAVQKLFTDFDQLLSQASQGELSEYRIPTPVHTANDDDDSAHSYKNVGRGGAGNSSSRQRVRNLDAPTEGTSGAKYEMSEAERSFFSNARSSKSTRQVASAGDGGSVGGMSPTPLQQPSSAPEMSVRRSRNARGISTSNYSTPHSTTPQKDGTAVISPEPKSVRAASNAATPVAESSDAFEARLTESQRSALHSSISRDRRSVASNDASVSAASGPVSTVGWFRSGATTSTSKPPVSQSETSTSVAPRYVSRLDRLKRLSGAPIEEPPAVSLTSSHCPTPNTSATPPASAPEPSNSALSCEPTPERTSRRPRRHPRTPVDEDTDAYLREVALQTMRDRSASSRGGIDDSSSSRASSVASSCCSTDIDSGDVSPSNNPRRDVFLCTPDGKAPFPIRDMYVVSSASRGCRPDSSTPLGAGVVEVGLDHNTLYLKRVPSASGSSLAAGRLYEATRLDKEVALAELEATRLKREDERQQRRQKRVDAQNSALEDDASCAPASTPTSSNVNVTSHPFVVEEGNADLPTANADVLIAILRPIQCAQDDDRQVIEELEQTDWVTLMHDAAASKEEYRIVEESRRRTERRRLEAAFSVAHERDAEREHRRIIEIVRDTLVEEGRMRELLNADEMNAFCDLTTHYIEASQNPILELSTVERLARTKEELRQWNVRVQLREDFFMELQSIAYEALCAQEWMEWERAVMKPFTSVFGAWEAMLEEECRRMDLIEEEECARVEIRPLYAKSLAPIVERDTWKVVVLEAEARLLIERAEPHARIAMTSTNGVLGIVEESEDGEQHCQVFETSRPLVVWYTKRVRTARNDWERHISAKLTASLEEEIKGRLAICRGNREDFILLEELSKRSVEQARQLEEARRTQEVSDAIRKAKELAEAQRLRKEEEAAKAIADTQPPEKGTSSTRGSRGPSQQRSTVVARGGVTKPK